MSLPRSASIFSVTIYTSLYSVSCIGFWISISLTMFSCSKNSIIKVKVRELTQNFDFSQDSLRVDNVCKCSLDFFDSHLTLSNWIKSWVNNTVCSTPNHILYVVSTVYGDISTLNIKATFSFESRIQILSILELRIKKALVLLLQGLLSLGQHFK